MSTTTTTTTENPSNAIRVAPVSQNERCNQNFKMFPLLTSISFQYDGISMKQVLDESVVKVIENYSLFDDSNSESITSDFYCLSLSSFLRRQAIRKTLLSAI
jgi:hypothetical protein